MHGRKRPGFTPWVDNSGSSGPFALPPISGRETDETFISHA